MTTFRKLLPALAFGLVAASAQAVPLLTLPTTPIDGLGPQAYDEGLVYSSSLLAQQKAAGLLPGNTSTFDFAVGSGTFDVIVYSNNGVANPVGFDEPMNAGGVGSFDGQWGMGMAGTVGMLRNLLTIGGEFYQPLFVFDHNENQQNPNLQVSGQVSIYRGEDLIDSFAFDTIANGSYDVESRVTSCGSPSIGPAAPTPYSECSIPAPTTSGTTYTWTTSGSGKPDYFAIFPTFNLYSSDFLNTDSIVVDMSLRNMNPGFDELAIAGYKFASTTTVPEPATLLLLGLGFLGVAAARRRKATV